jgi:DNA-binding XRE family transcriptional regulator
LRTSEWDRLTRARGLTTDTACADLLGISKSTISRARDNEVEPSQTFIRAVIWHLPGLKFEDLFEVVTEQAS